MKQLCRMILIILLALCLSAPSSVAESDAVNSTSEVLPDGEFAPNGPDFLDEGVFSIDDIPTDYLEPSDAPGTVEQMRYTTADGDTKSLMVYLPAGYAESEQRYPVLYLLHGSTGAPKNYLNPNSCTNLQSLLDNMIKNGDLQPLIVVAPTYYASSDDFAKYMPLPEQVKLVSDFPQELADCIVPAVEAKYRTYAETTDADGLRASRMQRAVAGFSLGGTAAWYTFLQRMDTFGWFLPISEASWDDGDGGISGIWDSDLSAKVLYEAVISQGFSKDDFRLFVATGTNDEAFEVSTKQMISLLEYADLFIPGENTSCSMMLDGTHTLSALYTYMYHILPRLFDLPEI